MQIGPVRYRFSAKDKVKLQEIEHYVYPRFTRLINTTGQDWKINEQIREKMKNVPADGYPKEWIEKTKELLPELTALGAAGGWIFESIWRKYFFRCAG